MTNGITRFLVHWFAAKNKKENEKALGEKIDWIVQAAGLLFALKMWNCSLVFGYSKGDMLTEINTEQLVRCIVEETFKLKAPYE